MRNRSALAGLLLAALGACAPHAAAATFSAGDSMIPTLAVDQTISVAPLANGPSRGQVIVFRAPQRPDREYVKRIVGIAGDTIAARGDEILINGLPIARCRVGAWGYGAQRGELWLEALDGATWLVFHDTSAPAAAPTGPWTVASGEVFVLGDNRDHAHDSRFSSGDAGVPLRLVVGAAAPASPRLPPGAEALRSAFDACTAELAPRTR